MHGLTEGIVRTEGIVLTEESLCCQQQSGCWQLLAAYQATLLVFVHFQASCCVQLNAVNRVLS